MATTEIKQQIQYYLKRLGNNYEEGERNNIINDINEIDILLCPSNLSRHEELVSEIAIIKTKMKSYIYRGNQPMPLFYANMYLQLSKMQDELKSLNYPHKKYTQTNVCYRTELIIKQNELLGQLYRCRTLKNRDKLRKNLKRLKRRLHRHQEKEKLILNRKTY